MKIRVIGGGLAGPEAALTAARLGCEVELYEMRALVDGQARLTPAHQTIEFGELVCSNSLKSESPNTAPWLLKQEMRRGHSVLLQLADETAVPAGHALAVDRVEFSRRIAEAIAAEPRIRVIREEVTSLRQNENSAKHCTILATGPLTSPALSAEIQRITGSEHLAFYDSISPIVDAETIDMERVYFAARWDKGTADYINCPMSREEYDRFYDALVEAEAAEAKEWEKLDSFPPHSPDAGEWGPRYFEGCLPIEILARRGRDTLRFGPMKPVGLRDPRTGKTPWAVVQLRKENLRADSYNLVGFHVWATDTRDWYENMLTMLMAGRAAEQLMLKRVSSGSGGADDSDLARATRLAFDMERTLGFGAEHPLLYRPHRDPGAVFDRDPELAVRVHARLEVAIDRAGTILRRRRSTFNALAKALFEAQAMDQTAVSHILADGDLPP